MVADCRYRVWCQIAPQLSKSLFLMLLPFIGLIKGMLMKLDINHNGGLLVQIMRLDEVKTASLSYEKHNVPMLWGKGTYV